MPTRFKFRDESTSRDIERGLLTPSQWDLVVYNDSRNKVRLMDGNDSNYYYESLLAMSTLFEQEIKISHFVSGSVSNFCAQEIRTLGFSPELVSRRVLPKTLYTRDAANINFVTISSTHIQNIDVAKYRELKKDETDGTPTVRREDLEFLLRQNPRHAIRIYSVGNLFYVFSNHESAKYLREATGILVKELLGNTLPEPVQNLLLYYTTGKAEEFHTLFHQLVDVKKLEQEQQEKALREVLVKQANGKTNALNRHITSLLGDIKSYEEALKNSYRTLLERQATLAGYELSGDKDKAVQDTLDYLRNRQEFQIVNVDTYSGYLRIGIMSTLEYWDEDAAERIVPNLGNELITKIILEKKIKIRLYNLVTIKQDNTYTYLNNTSNGEAYDYANHFKAFPQPHHILYNCLGQNKSALDRALANDNTIGFLEQFLAATKGINILDSIVISKFNNLLRPSSDYSSIPCLIYEDGTEHTIQEFYASVEEEHAIDPDFLEDNDDDNDNDPF